MDGGPTSVSLFFSFFFFSFHLRMKDFKKESGVEREREEKGLANGYIHYRQKIGVTPYYQSSNLTPVSR